ncbi:hypothetical protein [Ferrovibrio sp.]|uniref:hypothetical protein n=1 Tax=Ferrovibrio sp. TaxID=1917215 RepID=UPI003516A103
MKIDDQNSIDWPSAWDTLFVISRYILAGYAAVALACLTGMGSAGEAPGLLGFYMSVLALCAQLIPFSATTLGVVAYFRKLMKQAIVQPSSKQWYLKFIEKYKVARMVDEALPSAVQGIFWLMVATHVFYLILPPLYLIRERESTIKHVVCEAVYRKHTTIAGYRLGEDCENALGEKGKPDPEHFLMKDRE